MPKSSHQLQLRVGDVRQDLVGGAVERQPIAISPHQQHTRGDSTERKRITQLRDQAPGSL
jgi:hypothetical protein